MLNMHHDYKIHSFYISRKEHTKNPVPMKKLYGSAKEIYIPFSTPWKHIYSHGFLGQHEYVQTASAGLEAEK